MFTLINISGIIKEHYKTLKSDSKTEFILLIFFIIPCIVSVLLIRYDKLLTQNSVDSLITAYSIFTALLLNVIFIIYDIMGKIGIREKSKSEDVIRERVTEKKQKDLLEHLYSNSLYSLATSIAILMFLIMVAILEAWTITDFKLYKHSLNLSMTFSFFVYFLVIHFLMNLLMITKRLSALLSSRLKES